VLKALKTFGQALPCLVALHAVAKTGGHDRTQLRTDPLKRLVSFHCQNQMSCMPANVCSPHSSAQVEIVELVWIKQLI
jgi:hypothetical protein